MNTAIALAIVAVLMPFVKRGHQRAKEETKKNMPEGWLKTLLTREFWKR